MEEYEIIRKAIIDFAINHNLKIVNDVNNGSNFQMVFIGKDLRLEFIRDRGEIDLYFSILSLSDKMFSLILFSKLFPFELSKDASYESILNYFDTHLVLIKRELTTNYQEVLKKYDKLFIQTMW